MKHAIVFLSLNRFEAKSSSYFTQINAYNHKGNCKRKGTSWKSERQFLWKDLFLGVFSTSIPGPGNPSSSSIDLSKSYIFLLAEFIYRAMKAYDTEPDSIIKGISRFLG